MVNDSNEEPSPHVLGFEIMGATPEEEHQIIMMLCYLPKSHLKVVKQFIIVSVPEWESYVDDLRKLEKRKDLLECEASIKGSNVKDNELL